MSRLYNLILSVKIIIKIQIQIFMEKDKNIFDTASKKLGSKKKKGSAARPTPKKPVHRDPEIAAMLKQIDEMQNDLQNKFDHIKSQAGLTTEDIQDFMNNPKNFTPKQWEQIEQTKNELGNKVWAAIGLELKPKPRTRENIAGERKGKTLGGRKKWIPMR